MHLWSSFVVLNPSTDGNGPGVSPTTGVTSATPGGGNPTTAVPSSAGLPTPSVSVSQSATSGETTVNSSNPLASISASSNRTSASQTQTSSNLNPTSTGSHNHIGSSGVGSATSSGGSQPAIPSSGSSSGSGSGSTAGAEPSNGGVSKTVIIVVAVIASVFVLALLAAITWLLIRNQPAPRGDVEGTAGLMREAAPTAVMVSNPLPLSPMRPEIPNPFVDPLDDFNPLPRPART